jgi:hypothetical protein
VFETVAADDEVEAVWGKRKIVGVRHACSRSARLEIDVDVVEAALHEWTMQFALSTSQIESHTRTATRLREDPLLVRGHA